MMAMAVPSSAFAGEPWWHVTSGARPAYLQPGGVGTDEVQEMTVRATGGDLSATPCIKVAPSAKGELLFVSIPFNAEAAEVQTYLEMLLGAGNVLVTGGPVGRPEHVTGTFPYVIRFMRKLSEQCVRLNLSVNALFARGALR
jgi:hypothetical protein